MPTRDRSRDAKLRSKCTCGLDHVTSAPVACGFAGIPRWTKISDCYSLQANFQRRRDCSENMLSFKMLKRKHGDETKSPSLPEQASRQTPRARYNHNFLSKLQARVEHEPECNLYDKLQSYDTLRLESLRGYMTLSLVILSY